MVDRIIELNNRSEENIRSTGYAWYLDGDNSDYISSDVIMITQHESNNYIKAAENCFQLYLDSIQYVNKNNLWSEIGLPDNIIPLIKHDIERNLPHICGRMDLAGGVESLPIRLIEFNADTSTLLPESAYFQSWIYEPIRIEYKGQFNFLITDMSATFRKLRLKYPEKPASLLLTSLGHIEDQLNLQVVTEAAIAAGFDVYYSDLENVVFSDDGVFIETEDGYVQYEYIYKLVPWEFIMFDEPDLMDILTDLSIRTNLIVLNPSYSIALQAKHLMSVMYKNNPSHEHLLATYNKKSHFEGKKHVKKVNFGRLGENVSIVGSDGSVLSKNKGDYGHFTKVYQEYAEMYRDEDGDIYQAGMYLCDGKASCLSFRRRDGLIIDEDAEFVSHVLF